MGARNKFVKFIGYVFIYLVTAIQSYGISLTAMSLPMTLFCTVWNFIAPLPALLSEHYALVYLLASIPLGIVVFIYTVLKVNRVESKNNKKNRDNQ